VNEAEFSQFRLKCVKGCYLFENSIDPVNVIFYYLYYIINSIYLISRKAKVILVVTGVLVIANAYSVEQPLNFCDLTLYG
jgi:hypothetical protein